MAELSDADIGLSDDDIGLTDGAPEKSAELSDADIGLSDEDIGLEAKPKAEGPIAANVRAFAHGVIPAVGAAIGGGLVGGAIGGPVGGIIGGIAGGIAGGAGAGYVQEKALEHTRFDDSAQQAANAEEYPVSTTLSGLAPFAGNPGRLAGSLISRAAQGTMLGGLDAAQQKLENGDVDWRKVAASGAFGVAFPDGNRLTRAVSDLGAQIGRKNIWRRGQKVAEAQPEIDEFGDPTGDGIAKNEGPLAEPIAEAAGPGTGVQDPAQGGSAKVYKKKVGNTNFRVESTGPTTGDIKPDEAVAIQALEPEVKPEPEQLPLENPTNQQHLQARQGQGPTEFPPPDENLTGRPVGQTPGEPGPIAEAPIAPKRKLKKNLAERAAEVREDVHPTPSDAQIEAENFNKGHPGRFAGKAVSIETAKGGIRRSKPGQEPWEVEMPTDYGHLLGTKGADKDPLDIAIVGTGDKHFVIDQRDAETGKFDEHKIMAHAKDEADAIDHYNRGFSDGKGPQRIQGITEATEADINKFANRLLNMPAKRNQPYGTPPKAQAAMSKSKAAAPAEAEITATVKPPVEAPRLSVLPQDRVAVRDMLKDLRAKGGEDAAKADTIEAMSPAELTKYLEDNPIRRRNYGVKTGTSAGYPVADLKNTEGGAITANKPKLAAARTKAIEALRKSFADNPPAPNESSGATLDRVRAALKQVAALNDGKAHNADYTKGPLDPHNRTEWTWANEAKLLLNKATPGNVKKFRKIEDQLRDPQLALTYLKGRTIDGGVAKSRRAGDEAISRAENKLAQAEGGRNMVEENAIEKLAKERGDPDAIDVPHEEAEEYVKPVPVEAKDIKKDDRNYDRLTPAESPEATTEEEHGAHGARSLHVDKAGDRTEMAKALNTDRVPKWKQERDAKAKETREKVLEQLAARKAAEAKSDEGKKVAVSDADKAKYADMLKVAEGRDKARGKSDVVRGIMDDFKKFVGDEDAAGHPDRAIEDIGKVLDHIKKTFTLKYRDPKTWNAQKMDTPEKEYDQSLSDRFYQTKTQERAQTSANVEWAKARPKEISKALREKFAFARDEGNFSSLTPHELELYNERYPLRLQDNDALFDLAKTYDANETMGVKVQNHLYRIVKGLKDYDPLSPGQSEDPIEAINNVSTRAKGTALDRTFVALERDADQKRYVISVNKKGFTLWDGYKATRYNDPDFKFKVGEKYTVGPNTFTMKDSFMREIEANALGSDRKPLKYYHDIDLSVIAANEQLTKQARNMQFVHDLTKEPAWQARATQNGAEAKERGWEMTDLPAFNSPRNHWYVDKGLKGVIDSFAKPGFLGNDFSRWRMFGQMLAKSIFWNPVVHAANAGVHYTVGRGWDNVNLKHTYELFSKDLPSVIHQDALQREILDNGGALMYPGALHQRPIESFAKLLEQEIKRAPAVWDPIAKKFGMGPSDLIRAIYDGSRKSLWAANDMFYTNLYRMHRERGLSIKGAINATEQDFPNYRIPPQLLGSRALSKALEEPGLSVFGRYHVGMVNALANMVKGIIGKDATPTERFDAVGKLFVIGALGLFVKPYADTLAQMITGNEDASMTPRGALTLPFLLAKGLSGDEDITAVAKGIETFSPVVSAALQLYNNKDFSNKSIFEPGDVARATQGDLTAAGLVGVQGAEFGLRTISPFNTAESAYKKGQGPVRALADQLLGIHDPGPRGARWERRRQIQIQKAANTRRKQGGRGFGEELYNRMTGNGGG